MALFQKLEFEIIEYCFKYKKELNPKKLTFLYLQSIDLIIEIDGKQHNENLDKIEMIFLINIMIKTIKILQKKRKRNSDYYNKINEIREFIS